MQPELSKVVVALVLFLLFVPIYGVICSRYLALIRVNLAVYVFATSVQSTRWTLQICSIEWYKGHTRGFEINFLEALALASLIGIGLAPRRKLKLLVPALGLWVLYVLSSSLSIVNAIEPLFTAMSIFKFAMIFVIYVATFNSIESNKDIELIQLTVALALIVETLLCLKLRYFDGLYRIRGSFPHSNNLGMYAYMNGLCLLGTVLFSRPTRMRRLFLAAGYLGAMALAMMTVARASYAAAIVGSCCLISISIVMKPTVKKLGVALAVALPLAGGAAMAWDQIATRQGQSSRETQHVLEDSFRGVLIQQAQAMLADHPLGIGWNNFCLQTSWPRGSYSGIMRAYFKATRGYDLRPEHQAITPLIESHYWMLLGETGYAALTTYLLVCGAFLYYAARAAAFFRRSSLGALPLALVVVFSLLYLHGLVERIVTDTPVLTMFMIYAACAAKLHWWRLEIRKGKLTLAQVEGVVRCEPSAALARRYGRYQ